VTRFPALPRLSSLAAESKDVAGLRRLILGLAIGGHLDNADSQRGRATDLGYDGNLSDSLLSAQSDRARFRPLSSVAQLRKGLTPIKQAVPGPYPFVVTANARLSCDHYDFEGPAAIIPMVSSTGHGNASLKRLHYQEGQFAVGSILCAVFPRDPTQLSARFLYEYLSAFKDEVPIPQISTAAVSRLNVLMAICDELEFAQSQREAARDRLRTASLRSLVMPGASEDRVQFVLQNSARMISRPAHLAGVRQAVLDLAARGAMGIRHDEANSEMAPRHRFLGDLLAQLQTGPFGSSLHQSDYVPGGTPVINPASLVDGKIVPIAKMAVGDSTAERLASFKLREGDIVLARRGEMGRCAVVTTREAGWLCGTGSLILRFPSTISAEYMALVLGSPGVREYLSGAAVGATMQNLNQSILLKLQVLLPSLAEQHHVVAKVDELMAICDELEGSLNTQQAERSRLLESLLSDALGNEPPARRSTLVSV
jgi:type I restriction enzyme S subunit